MGHNISSISPQGGEDADNALQITDAEEQRRCDNYEFFPNGCGACVLKTQSDPPIVPTAPPSPAIRRCSALQNLPAELLLQASTL